MNESTKAARRILDLSGAIPIPTDSEVREIRNLAFVVAKALLEAEEEEIARAASDADYILLRESQARELKHLARIEKIEKERDELADWKEQALSVYPPMQEIGKALGLTLGASIYDKILPGIEALKAERDEWKEKYNSSFHCGMVERRKAEIQQLRTLLSEAKEVLKTEQTSKSLGAANRKEYLLICIQELGL